MYIWTAVDLDAPFAALRREVEAITASLRLRNDALTLPLHVSLRMSFPIEDALYPQALAWIRAYFRTLSPFEIHTKGIGRSGDILWCPMQANPSLEAIHAHLVEGLQADFGVPPHPFDLSFFWHATLFMGQEAAKTEEAYARIRLAAVPPIVAAQRLVIGASPSGQSGDFRVVESISLI